MNGHDEYLELLAASIDFGLTEEEVARLNYHLASCPGCRRAAAELRAQNAAIATTPVPALAPARSEQILRAALRRQPASRPRWGLLAVAAMLATLGGGVLFAGFQMITDDDPAPDQSPPIIAQVSAPPSADPGSTPVRPPLVTSTPRLPEDPEASATPDVGVIEFEFPRPYTTEIASVRVAPLADGRVWVSFRDGNGTVLALLDDTGAGSPMEIPGAEDCVPLAVADGSVRLVCGDDSEACIDTCLYEVRVHAYSATLDELPGYPVSVTWPVPGWFDRQGARVVGTDVVLGFNLMPDFDEGEQPAPAESHLVTVHADGSVDHGVPLEGVVFCCAISAEGVGFGTSVESHEDGTQTTTLSALDASGLVDGWPVAIEGTAGGPAFGPDGDVYVTSWVDGGSRIVRIHDATPVSMWDLPETITWDPTFDGPLAPLIGGGGRISAVGDGRILSFDGTGEALPGWPYEPETGLAERGGCPPGDTGCQTWLEPPRIAPRGLFYTIESPPEGLGERITAVNADGSVRSGWPKTLQRPGATWDSVTIGENRRAYTVAIEPEPNNESSISLLAFAPNGTREWLRVLVEP
jgi:hypothetical protein